MSEASSPLLCQCQQPLIVFDLIVSSFNTFPLCPVSLLLSLTPPHLTHQSFTHALFRLAANPEWIDVLRAEAEPVIAAEGLTKASIGKLWKLDSIMREALRYDGITLCMSPLRTLLATPWLNSDVLRICSLADPQGDEGRHSVRRHVPP